MINYKKSDASIIEVYEARKDRLVASVSSLAVLNSELKNLLDFNKQYTILYENTDGEEVEQELISGMIIVNDSEVVDGWFSMHSMNLKKWKGLFYIMLLRVFITNLGKYNEGELVGKWLELPCDNVTEELKSIGVEDGGEYEEYFITDYESDCGLECGEYENLQELSNAISELKHLLIEKGETEKLIQAIAEAEQSHVYEVLEVLKNYEIYFYEDKTLLDVAEEFLNEEIAGFGNSKLEFIKNYLNYELYADELDSGGFTETSVGVIEIL